jgi:hypothetical protein
MAPADSALTVWSRVIRLDRADPAVEVRAEDAADQVVADPEEAPVAESSVDLLVAAASEHQAAATMVFCGIKRSSALGHLRFLPRL